MIWDIGVHRTNDADVIDALTDVRKQIADFDSGFAVLLEFERGHQQAAGLSFRFQIRCRGTLPVILGKRRLRVERIDLRWSAVHEEVNDVLRSGREVSRLWSQRARRICIRGARQRSVLSQNSGQAEHAQPGAHALEGLTASHAEVCKW